jgi:hypothetical protein
LEDEKAVLQSRFSSLERSASTRLKQVEENLVKANSDLAEVVRREEDMKRENSQLLERSRSMEAEQARMVVSLDSRDKALMEEREKIEKLKRSAKKAVDELKAE